jgi:hypothetical protein
MEIVIIHNFRACSRNILGEINDFVFQASKCARVYVLLQVVVHHKLLHLLVQLTQIPKS